MKNYQPNSLSSNCIRSTSHERSNKIIRSNLIKNNYKQTCCLQEDKSKRLITLSNPEYFEKRAICILKETNYFGFPLWQEKPIDLVTLAFIKEWLDEIYKDESDPDNFNLFKAIKKELFNLKGQLHDKRI
tara:strand:+ start:330 stop:719 length:390 start_codon:yes stop_codon:yes gene_type:complete